MFLSMFFTLLFIAGSLCIAAGMLSMIIYLLRVSRRGGEKWMFDSQLDPTILLVVAGFGFVILSAGNGWVLSFIMQESRESGFVAIVLCFGVALPVALLWEFIERVSYNIRDELITKFDSVS